MENVVICPKKETCVLKVLSGKVYCMSHDRFLIIKSNWENKVEQIPMRHILYIAYSNGENVCVLIDEEV